MQYSIFYAFISKHLVFSGIHTYLDNMAKSVLSDTNNVKFRKKNDIILRLDGLHPHNMLSLLDMVD